MYKLGVEEAEEPEIQLPIQFGLWRKEGNSRKKSSLSMVKPLTVPITKTCGKSLQRWEYQTTYLSSEKAVCRLRSNRIKHETTDWLKIGRRVWQDCILSLFFSVYADNIMRNAELDESWAGIKTVRKNINNLRYANDTTLMAESEKELRSLLMRVRRRVEKLAWISKLRQLQSWHPVTTIYGK